jgi:hypothetical protein
MGKYWDQFRDRASRKEERSHFGLAWSVFAAYWLAGAVLLRSLHETGWLVTLADVGVILFFVFSAFGVYLAFAVPMRWWPHQPKKRVEAVFDDMETLFLEGLGLLEALEDASVLTTDYLLSGAENPHRAAEAERMREWSRTSEDTIRNLLGEDEALRYRLSPDLSRTVPAWAERTNSTGTWHNARGRIDWIRAWMQEQANL